MYFFLLSISTDLLALSWTTSIKTDPGGITAVAFSLPLAAVLVARTGAGNDGRWWNGTPPLLPEEEEEDKDEDGIEEEEEEEEVINGVAEEEEEVVVVAILAVLPPMPWLLTLPPALFRLDLSVCRGGEWGGKGGWSMVDQQWFFTLSL